MTEYHFGGLLMYTLLVLMKILCFLPRYNLVLYIFNRKWHHLFSSIHTSAFTMRNENFQIVARIRTDLRRSPDLIQPKVRLKVWKMCLLPAPDLGIHCDVLIYKTPKQNLRLNYRYLEQYGRDTLVIFHEGNIETQHGEPGRRAE